MFMYLLNVCLFKGEFELRERETERGRNVEKKVMQMSIPRMIFLWKGKIILKINLEDAHFVTVDYSRC